MKRRPFHVPAANYVTSDVMLQTGVAMRSDQLFRIYLFAQAAHQGQFRRPKEDRVPYFTHPVSVAAMAMKFQMSDYAIGAALLHDVVEDTDFTSADIHGLFGPKVGEIVDRLTKPEYEPGTVRAEKRDIYFRQVISSMHAETVGVKICDIIDNLRGMRKVDQKFYTVMRNEAKVFLNILDEFDSPTDSTWIAALRREINEEAE